MRFERKIKDWREMIKIYGKEKITKIMKKNKAEFVPAEFNACLLSSPCVYVSYCLMLV